MIRDDHFVAWSGGGGSSRDALIRNVLIFISAVVGAISARLGIPILIGIFVFWALIFAGIFLLAHFSESKPE